MMPKRTSYRMSASESTTPTSKNGAQVQLTPRCLRIFLLPLSSNSSSTRLFDKIHPLISNQPIISIAKIKSQPLHIPSLARTSTIKWYRVPNLCLNRTTTSCYLILPNETFICTCISVKVHYTIQTPTKTGVIFPMTTILASVNCTCHEIHSAHYTESISR